MIWLSYIPDIDRFNLVFFRNFGLKNYKQTVLQKLLDDPINQIKNKPNVAIIILYLGSQLPVWFDAFVFSTRSSLNLIDWYIFVTDDFVRIVPSNIKIIKLTRENVFIRVKRHVNIPPKLYSYGKFEDLMNFQINNASFSILEFKPMYADLFQDYISNYSHWGYADLDILSGRIETLVNEKILQNYDVYSISFGDTYRMYLRGQLTILKNNQYINSLWKECEHLYNFGQRLLKISSDAKLSKWKLQSAEGCFSKVVIDNNNVSVYIASGQFSDAYRGDLNEKETLLIGDSLVRCYASSIEEENQSSFQPLSSAER